MSFGDWIAQFAIAMAPQANTEPDRKIQTVAIMAMSAKNAPLSTDPDGTLDGAQLTNLLSYAHGTNPFQPDLSLLARPAIRTIDGVETPTIERAVFKFSQGLVTTLQESSDLAHWIDLPFHPEITKETTLHRWESIPLPAHSPGKFYRLKISLSTASKL